MIQIKIFAWGNIHDCNMGIPFFLYKVRAPAARVNAGALALNAAMLCVTMEKWKENTKSYDLTLRIELVSSLVLFGSFNDIVVKEYVDLVYSMSYKYLLISQAKNISPNLKINTY